MSFTETTANTSPHWGFELRQATYDEACRVLENIRKAGKNEPVDQLAKEAGQAVTLLTEAGFQGYYHKPTEIVPLPAMAKKTADTGIRGIEKAISFVIAQFFKKRTASELAQLADYLETMLHHNYEAKSHHLVFPISDDLHKRAVVLIHKVQNDSHPRASLDVIVETLSELVTESIDAYYLQPTAMVSIGSLTRKTADMSVKGVGSGVRSLIDKLIRQLTDEQLTALSYYLESMIHDRAA
ncbi:hypothetical protein [Allohahella marinimesophila]|uniref:Abortive infection Abi-like protein n=1 Tax=Allohahella marinimesophila TaxID=1054972 RepID=A0ABP7NP04_9GAMM